MNERDELLSRVTKANPVAHDAELPDDVVDSRPPLGLLISKEGALSPDARPPQSVNAERSLGGPLVAAGTAVAILAVVAGSLLLLRTGQDEVTDQSIDPVSTTIESAPPTTLSTPPTTIESAPTTVVVSPESWDAILATTMAGVAPPAAECPAGSNRDVPGPVDQVRPGEGPWSNQAAVFDTHQGRIVYLDETGETWTFDVCTNTWHAMNPTGTPYGGGELFGELVYDVDSDRTIAFGPDNYVSVYDANINTWTQRVPDPDLYPVVGWPQGAVYDPISGLVLLVTDDGGATAYDVEADTWTAIGIIIEPREETHEGQTQTVGPPFLIGHLADTDRLAFLPFSGAPWQEDGKLVNPRDGSTIPLKEPDRGVTGGFGSFRYATGGETAYTHGADGVCRLDPVTLDWDCHAGSQRGYAPAAMVYDPINSRIVVINDFCCAWPGTTVSDDVWAISFNTGETIELLAAANTRIETDGSTTTAPTTVPPPPTTVVVSPESWDPILATTAAAIAPPAAECPADSNPEVPGPVDQLRPDPHWVGSLAGAFDQRAGAVVYVDVTGETWLFDVCTNTWNQPDPDGAPAPADQDERGQLVYDVDSDVTIAFEWSGRVSVYDANTNTWEQRVTEVGDGLGGPLGAVYDPVSGLVITSTQKGDEWDLLAYDVDTNEWTLLGPVTIDRDGPCCTQIDLLGYSDDLDRLILTTYIGGTVETLLVDPRTGEMVINPTPEGHIVNLVWPGHAYGTGDGTVHVYRQDRSSVCWFDAASLGWPCLVGPPDMPERYVAFGAIFGDPINNRLLFVHGVHGDWWADATDDVWALDLDNMKWNEVLAPSQR